MRSDLHTLENIENFLNGTLKGDQLENFKNEISTSSDLREALETQKLIQQAIIRKSILSKVQQFSPATLSSISLWARYKMPIILSSLLLLGLISVALVITSKEKVQDTVTTEENVKGDSNNTATTENSENNVSSESNSTSSADTSIVDSSTDDNSNLSSNNNRYSKDQTLVETTVPIAKVDNVIEKDLDGLKTWITPNKQVFDLNSDISNTIECENGTLIIVPQNAFCDKDGNTLTGNVNLEVVEALNMADMIAYNLTTMSNGEALSSGGMLYIQPLVDNKKVFIHKDKPLHIEVPTDSIAPGMMAWKGVVDSNGDINWVEPKELEKFLIPVDFATLDFFPDGFEDAVDKGMPYKNEIYSNDNLDDSLYYSLVDRTTESRIINKENNFRKKNRFDKLNTISEYESLKADYSPEPMKLSINVGDSKVKIKNESYKFNLSGILPKDLKNAVITVTPVNKDLPPYIIKDFISIPGGKTTWVESPITFIIPKNKKYGRNYIVSIKTPCSEAVLESAVKVKKKKITSLLYEGKPCIGCFINPLSIKAIKNTPFANTFLATKEFEERLKALHKIPNAQIYFDMYVNNLSLNLYEVDQMVADQVGEVYSYPFQEFANQKLTNVENSNINQEALKEFYTSSRSKYTNEVRQAQAIYQSIQDNELESLLGKLKVLEANYESTKNLITGNQIGNRRARNFPSISFGLDISFTIPRSSVANSRSYKASWNSTGWVNIDAYLHLLGADDQIVIVHPQANKSGLKVYQCINTLKTVIPLNVSGEKIEVHFPKKGNPGADQMKDTYCVGIHQEEGQLKYAEKVYNPYDQKDLGLEWRQVTKEQLYQNLLKLSPANNTLVENMKIAEDQLNKEMEHRKKRAEINQKIDDLVYSYEKEQKFIHSLVIAISPCAISSETPILKAIDSDSFSMYPEPKYGIRKIVKAVLN